MSTRHFAIFCLIQIMMLIIVGLFFWFNVQTLSKTEAKIKEEINSQLTTIVVNTIKLVKEDISALIPSVKSEETPEEKNNQSVVAGEEVSVLNGSEFYINGNRFQLGDIVYPYGVAVRLGRNVVLFQGIDGTETLVCNSVKRFSRDKEKPEEKTSKDEKELDKKDKV